MNPPAPPASTSRPLRLLLLQAQTPFDPTSGAAQSMRQIAELLAGAGVAVHALTTSLCEGDVSIPPAELMRAAGATVTPLPTAGRGPARWRAHRAGVDYEVMQADPTRKHSWEHLVGANYDRRLASLTREFSPHVVLTFGGDPTDTARRRRLRQAGARVVFALHNLAYLDRRPDEVDTFLAPTRFLAARYEAAWSTSVATLPPPIDPAHCLAPHREPVCIAYLNPEPAKGAALVAHLAARLGRERPDVPLLVVGGRAPATDLIAIGQKLGLTLADLPNLLQVAPTARPADWLGACRVLLAPSIVAEAAGRIPIEAMANGVVPLVSDRGGLPEMVGDAGLVLPLPPSLTLAAPWDVPEAAVDLWWRTLVSLLDDEPAWRNRSAVAEERSATFFPNALASRYLAFFNAKS